MANELQEKVVDCPYCGEQIELVVDCSVSQQTYIEDCQVCCRPMIVAVTVDVGGDASVVVSSDGE
jgi:hypothetical protein